MNDAQPNEIKNSSPGDDTTPRVVQRVTDVGYWYRAGDLELGPFTVEQEQDPNLDLEIAAKLGVDPKDILKARLREAERNLKREITISELNEILSTTVKHDEANKAITFLGMLLAQTDEDQYNIAFQAESSTGKSYIPLELAQYFPEEERRIYGGASPTSFYHEVGKYMPIREAAAEFDLKGIFDAGELADEKRKVIVVDLERKVLIFMDQPHWMLMEKLRPLLSHDMKLLRYSTTDKTGKGGLRTKTVIIRGYPTAIFATAKPTQEDQERTRMWLLSPEVSQEKFLESLKLLGVKIGHREAFREWIETHPQRRWLKERIRQIRATGIRNVIIPDWKKILERYGEKRPYLSPRSQRDWPRLLFLIKGCALLNCFQRVRSGHHVIITDQRDIDMGLNLYESIASSNELGLSPETYRIYEEVILPLAQGGKGVPKKEIAQRYFSLYHRPLADDRLRRQILPALESTGLIHQEPNPADKREMLVYCTVPSPISPSLENRGKNGAVYSERRQAGIDWLSDPRNLDGDGWAPLDKFTEVVGGPETVQHMLREGIIMIHSKELNKIRLLRR
jgi:hypothetical protein